MKRYCIFLQMSTGYIEGSIPPRFSEDNKKPIEGCGSDAYILLDGRKSINTLYNECMNDLHKRPKYIGFKIVSCSSIGYNERLLANYIYPNTIK